jgi:hypothetical protein
VGHARDWLSIHYSSFEPIEGMNAFVEKRQPGYKMLREQAASPEGSSSFPWGSYAKSCPGCGARFMPSQFGFCGQCGKPLDADFSGSGQQPDPELAKR